MRSHDASHYLLRPQAVATAWDAGQVAAIMGVCARRGVPLTFRAGGTSLSGQALSDGVLVDTRAGFTGVEVLDGGARVRVQPGVTVRMVNARLAPYRRKLGPDPASEIACTLGGVIANNSSGMQCGTELNSYATVESMVVVLPSGTVVDTSLADADRRLAADEPDLHAGLRRLRDRVRGDAASVATVRRLFSIKNTMGYGLNAFLDADEPADILLKLMVGSEGTLGFIASAVLRTVEVLPHVGHRALGAARCAYGVRAGSRRPRHGCRHRRAARRGVAAGGRRRLGVPGGDPPARGGRPRRPVGGVPGILSGGARRDPRRSLGAAGRAAAGAALRAHHRREGTGQALAHPQGPLLGDRRCPAEWHQRAARGRRRARRAGSESSAAD